MSFSLPIRLAPRAACDQRRRPVLTEEVIEEILGLLRHHEPTEEPSSSESASSIVPSMQALSLATRSSRARRRKAQKQRRKRKEQSELEIAGEERLTACKKELKEHQGGQQAIEHDLRGLANIQWRDSDITDEARKAVAAHIQDCQTALPHCTYNKLWALLWHNELPESHRTVLGRAMTFISRLYDILDSIDFLQQTIRRVKQPKLQQRRGYPAPQFGFFGYEFDPSRPTTCVGGRGTMSEFIEPVRLKSRLTAKEEQKYLIAGLRIRITRLHRARDILRQEGNAAHPCHLLAFSAYHEWLQTALQYVHSRAYHPGKLQDDTWRLDMRPTGQHDGDSWLEFEMSFRELVGTILSEDQKAAWARLIRLAHTHPLTGVECCTGQVPGREFAWIIWLNDEELLLQHENEVGDCEDHVVRLSDVYGRV